MLLEWNYIDFVLTRCLFFVKLDFKFKFNCLVLKLGVHISVRREFKVLGINKKQILV